VTLETVKWARICRDLGHSAFFCAGQLDSEISPGVLVPEAHFTHPEIVALHQKCFGVHTRSAETTEQLHELRGRIKAGLAGFVKKFAIDLLVPQNVLTIPMNLPLGMALTEFIAETGIHAIAHHHDFYWERQRFMINAVQDILDSAFPPSLSSIKHVVINTPGRRELAQRKGIAASLIPNVFDFDTEPPAMDEYGPRPARADWAKARRHPDSPTDTPRLTQGRRACRRVGATPEGAARQARRVP